MFGTAQKVRILGHLPALVSGRGPSELPEYFADRARWRFVSFDEAVSNMHETYTIALAQFGAANPQAHGRPNMILMAGWSETRGRPECWVVDSGKEAAGAQQIMNTCAPSSPDLAGRLGVMGLPGGMASFDPPRDGLRIMRAQRDLRFPHLVSGEMQPAVRGRLLPAHRHHRAGDLHPHRGAVARSPSGIASAPMPLIGGRWRIGMPKGAERRPTARAHK